jgi:hypothetical protein
LGFKEDKFEPIKANGIWAHEYLQRNAGIFTIFPNRLLSTLPPFFRHRSFDIFQQQRQKVHGFMQNE